MTEQVFEKILTANDTGETGGHQAGIYIPKSQPELIHFLPSLDASIKNPDSWLVCIDEEGQEWSFRFIYYNNKFFDPSGTRNEYRITHMTQYFRSVGASEGDIFRISGGPGNERYQIEVKSISDAKPSSIGRIRLKGWRRVH
ncbi:MAG: restriction endonuclease [Aestuariivita sp.]|nr:restriction endonuclease [Aestuariivita sp.]